MSHSSWPTVRTVRKRAEKRLARRAKKKHGKGKLGVISTAGVSVPPWLRRQLQGK